MTTMVQTLYNLLYPLRDERRVVGSGGSKKKNKGSLVRRE
jgi:hypothetical protein